MSVDFAQLTRRDALRRLALVALGAAAVPSLGALESCGASGPRPIAYGREECAWCRMTVSDARYGALTMTRQGKQLVFDSLECLADATLALAPGERQDAARHSWVTDYMHPGVLVPAPSARYLRSAGPGSPMGRGLKAFATAAAADAEQRADGGVTMSWDELLTVAAADHAARG